ncbi:MAG: prepilin peptidase CpaA [Planctomycetota bacterium]|jgi:prepilin peptidase CpaA
MQNEISPSTAIAADTDSEPELEVLVAPGRGDGSEDEVNGSPVARVAAAWVLGLSMAAIGAASLQYASKQTDFGFFLLSFCFVVVFGATWSDVATRRIPNALTYPAIILGLLFNGALPLLLSKFDLSTAEIFLGASGTIDCIQGFGLCATIGIVSFIARGLGGGDVKLLAAVGAIIGFHGVVAVLFNTLIVAALIGVINWVAGGMLMRKLQSFAHAVYFSLIMRADMRTVYRFRPTESPFALSLLIGLVLAQFVALHRTIFSVTW